jgi:hypothetical protein
VEENQTSAVKKRQVGSAETGRLLTDNAQNTIDTRNKRNESKQLPYSKLQKPTRTLSCSALNDIEVARYVYIPQHQTCFNKVPKFYQNKPKISGEPEKAVCDSLVGDSVSVQGKTDKPLPKGAKLRFRDKTTEDILHIYHRLDRLSA